jgi:hypothetical protein
MSAITPRTPLQHLSPSFEVSLSISALRRTRVTPPASPRLLPNLLLAGVSHAGAAMLADDLGRHPAVCLPDVRRINYFTPLIFGRVVETPLDDYDRYYSRWVGERFRIETGPDYFDGGLAVTARIAESLPGVRIVVLLRDPAQRLWTGYVDKLTRGRLPRAMSYETYIDHCLALRSNHAERFEGNRHFRTLSSGFYARFLPDWFDTFGDRVRVVFTENLRQESRPWMQGLYSWLGLDPAEAGPSGGRTDGTGGYPPSEPPSGPRRLWPIRQRIPAPWARQPVDVGSVQRVPRPSDRTLARAGALYASANRELASLLRGYGYDTLPRWLVQT